MDDLRTILEYESISVEKTGSTGLKLPVDS